MQVNNSLPPFSKEYVCPHCGFLDLGLFCSACAGSLKIPIEDIQNQLQRRLTLVGYLPYSAWKNQYDIIARDYVTDAYVISSNSLYMCNLQKNGYALEMIFIANSDTVTQDMEIDRINEYVTALDGEIVRRNSLPIRDRSKNASDYVESITIRCINIKRNSGAETQFSNKKKIETKTGTRFGLFSSSNAGLAQKFFLNIKWEKIDICIDALSIKAENKKMFDLVKHQAQLVLKQTQAQSPLNEQINRSHPNQLLEVFHNLTEDFVNYFKIFFQYIQYPYYFSTLVAQRKIIKPSYVIKLYLIGLVCSVSIPYLLTKGYLNTNNLTLFSDLPPFLDEIAELLTYTVLYFFMAVIIHVVVRIMKYQGSLLSLFIGLIFMQAFLQLIDRSYDYLTGSPLLNLLGGNTKLYQDINFKFLSKLYFLVYAYFFFPMMSAVYKASTTISVVAISIAGTLVIVISSFATGDFIYSASALNKERIQQLLNNEKQIVDIYKNEFIPKLEFAEKSGDYSKALSSLKKCEELFSPIVKKCDQIKLEVDKNNHSDAELNTYTIAACDYFHAREDLFLSIESVYNGSKKSFSNEQAVFDEKMNIFVKEINKK
ncbi:MAG: hypothetical protein ACXV8S_05440 [Methylobacter sp.]